MSSHDCQPGISSAEGAPKGESGAAPDENSYREILKSSTWIGGSSLLSILIGIVRTKAMAELLGPTGLGLMSLYAAIASLAQSIAEMGINSSGVRQIAASVASGDSERIARSATVLRRVSVLLGLLGAALLILFATPVAQLTFNSDQHSGSVALLSLVVLFGCIAGGQGALIQGMRRIADLAKMGVLGSLFGICISLPLVYWYGEQGIVPSLAGVAAMGILTSWWYSRKLQVQRPVMSIRQAAGEVTGLLKLGSAFMASALMMAGAAYVVRLILSREVGFEAAGLYQAAWTLGGLYVGFILQAMGADFYPRLTGVATDNAACNRMVNEQAQVSLLLAGPGVLATLTFAPLFIALFYTAEFAAAGDTLRWLCLGMALRVITWPMGFIILAKGAQTIYFLVELAWTFVNVSLTWVCVKSFGVGGAGIAFFVSYLFHGLLIYPIVHRLSGFRWAAETQQIGIAFVAVIAVVFCGQQLLPILWAYGLGITAIILSSVYSLRRCCDLVGWERLPVPLQRVLVRFRPGPSGSKGISPAVS